MERKVAVLISWVNTFISYKEFDELFHGAHKDSPLIHDKYHRNYEFVRLLNEIVHLLKFQLRLGDELRNRLQGEIALL